MMNCKELAGELLDLRLRMLHEPAEQILVSFHKGGQFVLLITRTAEVLEALGSHDAEEYFRIQKRIFELTYNTRKDECL